MEAVFQQVSGHGVAESVEEIGADAHQRKVDPRFVAEQVGEGFERELLGPHGLDALFREQAAGQGAQCGQAVYGVSVDNRYIVPIIYARFLK